MVNRLNREDRVLPDETIGSDDGRLSPVMQADANPVLYCNLSTKAWPSAS